MLDLIKMGNPLLRTLSECVLTEDILTNVIQIQIDSMITTMRSKNGAGIAAPQIGQLNRIFIMEMDNNPRYPDQDTFSLLTAINPSFKPLSDETIKGWEGCLSIPGIRGEVTRLKSIELTALDRNGNHYTKVLNGFASVVAQHEIDHLDGVLFIDRMENLKKLSYLEEYLAYHKT